MFDVRREPATRALIPNKPSANQVSLNLQAAAKVLGRIGQINHHRHLAI
jgi:hypothetical protein